MKQWDCLIYVHVRVKAKNDKEAATKALRLLPDIDAAIDITCEHDDCTEVKE